MGQAPTIAAAMFVLLSFRCGPAANEDSSGCRGPVGRELDGIERGDGGNWVTGDGGTWFMPTDPFVRPLPATPKLETLCMLGSGSSHGTWIGDIPMILGRPNSPPPDSKPTQMRYLFWPPRDGSDVAVQRTESGKRPKEVALTLTFERVDAVWAPASDGVPVEDPYFLSRIDATGIEPPACWSPCAEDSGSCAVTPCDECKRNGRDFFLCKDLVEHIEDCYAH